MEDPAQDMKTPIEFIAKNIYAPSRIDGYLTKQLEGRFSRQEVKRSIESASVLLNDKPARPRDLVKEGDRIHGDILSQGISNLVGENIPLDIVYEDDSLYVIHKPVGMVVHPGAGNKKGTLVNALLGLSAKLSSVGDAERPGIVHRLDKETSGLLLVAKNNQAHRALQEQFASRSLSKTYTALVRGRVEFEEGHLDASMARDTKIRQKMAVSQLDTARPAETLYRVLKRFKHTTLLEIKLITGRTHQIRVHMEHLGYPVVGDKLYGSRADQKCPRMALHASKIEFLHPKTGKIMRFEAPIPAEMKKMIEAAEQE